jgi:pimeloyl-ACP methyl ester carboxylesterase
MTVHITMSRTVSGSAAGITFLRRQGEQTSCPVMLLHGIGSNAHSFEPLLGTLPPEIDAIAWNAPGYDASQRLPAAAPTPRDYANALAAFCDALKLTKVIIVGHSLGALFAARFAAQYPTRVAALALLSPALGYRVRPSGALPPTIQARIDEIEALGQKEFAAKRAARLVFAPERKPKVLAAVRDAMASVNVPAYIQAVRALAAGDLLADAAAIAAPTIVGVGAEDVIAPPANARAAHAALAHPVAFHEIAGVGHALPQENPEAVAGIVSTLMERVRG